jgi:hypothetical protein
MSRFITANAPVGICDRCRMKRVLSMLEPDRDARGLLVCRGCNDERDPYKLPARKSENITLRRIRNDVPLS